MKSLEQFKAEHGIDQIKFFIKNGKPYANILDMMITQPPNFDKTKPVFVSKVDFIKDDEGKPTIKVDNYYTFCNSDAKEHSVF